MALERFETIKAYYTHYRQSLAGERARLKENDRWYMGKQTEYGTGRDMTMPGAPMSRTGHLFNAIQYKHADIMDNFPQINVLPREQADEEEAKILSGIMPFILENCHFKKRYSLNSYEKLKSGTAVYGVFYKQDGRNGDIDIEAIDLLRLSYQPGITDIQDSKYVFYDYFMDLDEFKELYGERKSIKTQSSYDGDKGDSSTDLLSQVVVVTDCYYKLAKGDKKILHFVKFSGSEILDYTEGKEEYKDGFYKHGKYPFVFDVLHPVPGTVCGLGIIDIGKNPQAYIDKMDEIINKNALISGVPRHIVNQNAGVNEDELLDLSKPLVHIAGSVNEENFRKIDSGSLPSYIAQHRQNKIEELKEILGNRDFAQGGTSGGVTAASAITALQNSGDKLSRDMIGTSYQAFADVIWFVIELVREFYTEERTFRVLGEDAKYKYVTYKNSGMQARPVLRGEQEALSLVMTPEEAEALGAEVEYEKPLFDITLTVEKNNPYQRAQHNELILALYNMGLFAPDNLALGGFVVSNLNFDGKDELLAQMEEIKQSVAGVQAEASAPRGEEDMLAVPLDGGMMGNSPGMMSGEDMLSSDGEMLAVPMEGGM